MRHISLSTCGVVPRIYELAEKKLGLTLSISLHAPNDKIRSQTMPVNSKWNIEELFNRLPLLHKGYVTQDFV